MDAILVSALAAPITRINSFRVNMICWFFASFEDGNDFHFTIKMRTNMKVSFHIKWTKVHKRLFTIILPIKHFLKYQMPIFSNETPILVLIFWRRVIFFKLVTILENYSILKYLLKTTVDKLNLHKNWYHTILKNRRVYISRMVYILVCEEVFYVSQRVGSNSHILKTLTYLRISKSFLCKVVRMFATIRCIN